MRVEGWRVDGFGVFSASTVEELPTGLTIVSGPNEAGKSTLLAFLRGVLFGFPDGRSRARSYEPVHGGRHGGAVSVLDGDGARWVVERHQQPRSFTLRGPDGSLAEDHRLAELLGHADASLFANVFAFGLGELDSFELLDSDEVRDRVFAAGVVGGGRSARAALDSLDERRAALLRPRGRCTIRDLADDTRAASRRLGAARGAATDLVVRREEVAGLLDAVGERRAEVEASRRAVRRARLLLDAWPLHCRVTDIEEQLDAAGPGEPLAEEVVRGLEERGAALTAALSALDAAERDLVEAEGRRDQVEADDDVHAQATAIADVGDGLAAEVARTERLGELDTLVESRRIELDEHLRHLGPEWDRAHLAGFDVSIPAADEVRRLGDRSATIEATLAERTAERDALDRELTEVVDELEQIAQAGEAVDHPDLERRSRALRQLRADLVDLGTETERLDAAHGTVSGLTNLSSKKGGRRTTSIGVSFVVVGLVVGLAGAAVVASDRGPIGVGLAITGLSAIVLGIVVLVTGRTSASPEVVANLRADLRDARRVRDDIQARIDLLRTRVHASALVLGLPPEPLAEDVERCASEIEDAERRAQQRVVDRDRRAALEVRASQLRARVADAGAAVVALDLQAEEGRAEWDAWTRERRVSSELGVGAVNDLFTGIERARGVLRELEAAEAERGRLDEASSRWRARASDVCASLGEDVTDPLDATRRVLGRLAADQEARRSLAERSTVADEARCRRDEAATTVAVAQDGLDAVWEELGVGSEAEAEALVARDRDRRRIGSELDAARSERRAVVGRGPDADEILVALTAGTPDEWEDTIRVETDRVAGLEAAHDVAIRVHHDAERDLEHLSRSADVAEASLELESNRTRLADAVEEWRTLTAARTLIADTLARYERERQPAVLARAEEWFAHVTDDHYVTVTVADGEIVLIDEGGRRLTTDDLSRGTSEQLYLCLRFGLAAEMVAHTPLPFVMDDVLVNFDPERTQRMAEVLASIAADHQILLFTCQPSTVEALLAASPSAKVIELPRHGVATQAT